MDDDNPRERIEKLERNYDKIILELSFITKRIDKSDQDVLRIYEKLDSMKNMVIASLISTILTLVGIIFLYVKG